MAREIVGRFTDLIVGKRTFYFPTDMQAMEVAESLPDCVSWQVKLQNEAIVDSKVYRETKKPDRILTPPSR